MDELPLPPWVDFVGEILDDCERELIALFGPVPNHQTLQAFDVLAKVRKRIAEGVLAEYDRIAAEHYAERKATGKKPCDEEEEDEGAVEQG